VLHPPPGPPGRARNVRSFRRAQAGTTAARVLEIAARAQLARAAGAGWSPLFTRVDGSHRGKSSFRSGLTSLLRDGLNLGAGVTAKSLRWAAVDHFMGPGYTADQRKGAGHPHARRQARQGLAPCAAVGAGTYARAPENLCPPLVSPPPPGRARGPRSHR